MFGTVEGFSCPGNVVPDAEVFPTPQPPIMKDGCAHIAIMTSLTLRNFPQMTRKSEGVFKHVREILKINRLLTV